MAGRKYSRQREAIREYLDMHRDHPTAEEVYLGLREEDPHLSLGTVYRNLSLLADLGEIIRIRSGAGPDHFDADLSPHQHFMCRCCGKVLDMSVPGAAQLLAAAADEFSGELETCTITFSGLCGECAAGDSYTAQA